MFFYDPLSLMIMLVAMVLAGGAQLMVSRAYHKYREVRASSGMTGAQAAAYMLRANGVAGVDIQPVEGTLSDHYDPSKKVLRLSADVYDGTSLAALGIACHEAGHALQHAKGYTPLFLRSAMVPVAGFGSNAGVIFIILGIILSAGLGIPAIGGTIAMVGFFLFLAAVLFSIVTLPVEFDASRRAKQQLVELRLISGPAEEKGISAVLNAAALTYLAAAIIAVLELLKWAYYLGLLGGRRND
jgi:hypothetical protein